MRVPAKFREGIERVGVDDVGDLKDFQLREFGNGTRQVDENRSRWLFEHNPCSSGGGWDIWICRRGGTIVGQQGEIPFDLRVGHADLRASWGVDLRVDEAWRLRGVGPALLATLAEARPLALAINVSESGFALMSRSGWSDLGIVPVYLRPLRLDRMEDLAPVGRRIRPMLRLAAPLFTGADGLAATVLRLSGLHLEQVDRFDERVDEVWARVEREHPVLARRDYTTLRWLLDQRPDRSTMQRYYLCRRGRTLGYVVLRMAGSADCPTAVVVDYLAPPRLVTPMLLAAAARVRRQGAIALSVKTRNGPADRYLRAAGFLRRARGADEPIRFMAHCASEVDAEVRAKVTTPGNWFVTSADCDLEHGMTPAAG